MRRLRSSEGLPSVLGRAAGPADAAGREAGFAAGREGLRATRLIGGRTFFALGFAALGLAALAAAFFGLALAFTSLRRPAAILRSRFPVFGRALARARRAPAAPRAFAFDFCLVPFFDLAAINATR